ncbi:MAG: transcription-repair coupling factor, partial [Terriglobia bacterium]
ATFLEWLEPGAGSGVAVLPFFDVNPYEKRSPHAEIAETRAITLWKLAREQVRIVLAAPAAACGRFRERVYYRSLALELKTGDEISIEDLAEHLAGVGYEAQEPVDSAGFYSVRGGIVDVYSPDSEWPFRIEFYGDQIESLRQFDPVNQRSRGTVDSVLVLPLSENRRSPQFFSGLVRALAERSGQPLDSRRPPEWAAEHSAAFPGWEFFAPFAELHPLSIFGLLDRPVVVWDEPEDCERQIEDVRKEWQAAWEEVRDVAPPFPPPGCLLLGEAELRAAAEPLARVSLEELAIESGPAGRGVDGTFVLATQPAPKFHGAVKSWIEDLRARRDRGERVVMALSSIGKIERLSETLKDYEIPFTLQSGNTAAGLSTAARPLTMEAGLIIVRGDVAEGAAFPETHFTVLGEKDLFGGFEWGAPGRREKSAVQRFISDLSDLKPGDYVVHVDHGIGIYQGLRQIEVEGAPRDFMLLTYQDDSKLYVPSERLDLVDKYRSGAGEGGSKPALDRLGGATWARTKTRIKRALRDMTGELLKLYAERKMEGGVAFGADTPWQKEFEDAFEYEETPDQLKALAEIRTDLENPQPMDRLLCGDVGYGKTELAMRAAFKAVQDGKQVAVLTPTTVLAFQHFTTFRQRMASFPVRVEMISRFRSAAEQKKIAADAADGKVDILIGTHRLLSKDIDFKDLGLLVVDEEQRFGVAAKEKLKRLRTGVDVLTMSATPIPRTLHMSLGGLRDLSVIETPPRGRLAIQTTVAPFNSRLIQAAILHEMEREGQVYFVHNRVESIFKTAANLQQLAPAARLGVAHGQMGERDLERVMMKFVQHEYDVLVSTAIIENGLDIPRANTIIINHAERFGLSELYQLRGRVGRSDRPAYAYLLIPSEDALTPVARRRLAALKEFSDLGAGFRLAALDLELRGAGNVLGAEQSGHLNAIGLDLYLKMLEQTVEEMKGLPLKPEIRATINLGLEIKIPDSYISDEGQRLRMYKRISSIASSEEREELEAELADRYGPLPPPVSTLLDYALVKSRAEQLFVQAVDRKQDDLWIRFHPETQVQPESLTRFVRKRRDASLRPDGALRFRMRTGAGPLAELTAALQELAASH